MTEKFFSPGTKVAPNGSFYCEGREPVEQWEKGEELVVLGRAPDNVHGEKCYRVRSEKDGFEGDFYVGFLELVITDEVIDNARRDLDKLLGEVS